MERSAAVSCSFSNQCPLAQAGVGAPCAQGARHCGLCVYFEAFDLDAAGRRSGRCRLGVVPRFFACTQAACPQHKARPVPAPPPSTSVAPPAVAAAAAPSAAPSAVRQPAAPAPVSVPSTVPASGPSCDHIAAQVLRRELTQDWRVGQRVLVPRFAGGSVVIQVPGGAERQQLTVEQLFRRLCHIKGSLARLEEALEAQDGFTSEERQGFQRHLRGIEGSLTTFNFLFNKGEGFQGTGQK